MRMSNQPKPPPSKHEEMPDSPPPAYEVVYPHLATQTTTDHIQHPSSSTSFSTTNSTVQNEETSSPQNSTMQETLPKPDRLSEPRLSPAANEMIRNYNNNNNRSKSSPRFPHKENPAATELINSYNDRTRVQQARPKQTVVISQQPQQPQVIVVREQAPQRTTEDQITECCCAVCTACCLQLTIEVCCRAFLSCGN